MIDVTVVIATCGSDEWVAMGDAAAESAKKTGAKVVRLHSPYASVSEARNKALQLVTTEYVVFLDADDSLDARYFTGVKPKHDVTATLIKYPYHETALMPAVWQHENYEWKRHDGMCGAECLIDGNWVHIGAICRTEAVKAVGGFKEYLVYEDWALFLSMQQNGATFGYSLGSIYLAATRENKNHRNHSIPLEQRNAIHEIIVRELIKE